MKSAEQWYIERVNPESDNLSSQDIRDIQQDIKDSMLQTLRDLGTHLPDHQKLIENVAKAIDRKTPIV